MKLRRYKQFRGHPRRVYVYCRVSTTDQTTENQIPDILRYLETRDEPIIYPPRSEWKDAGTPPPHRLCKWILETGSGMQIKQRLGYRRLRRAVRRNRVTEVVLWRLDRLGRACIGLHRFVTLCKRKDCNLVSLKERFDLNSAVGKLMFAVLASMAEFEWEIRKERQTAGIRRTAETAKRIYEQFLEGVSIDEICRRNRVLKHRVEIVIQRQGLSWIGVRTKPVAPGTYSGHRKRELTRSRLATLVAAGIPATRIGRLYNMTRQTVYSRMKEWNIVRGEVPPEVLQ